MFQRFRNSQGWCSCKPKWIGSCIRIASNFGNWLEAVFFDYFLAHQDQGRCPVIHGRCIGCSHSSIWIKNRLQGWDFIKYYILVFLVFGNQNGFTLSSLELNGYDLIRKHSCFPCGCRPLVRLNGIGILLGSTDIHFLGSIFSTVAHWEFVIHLKKSIANEPICQLSIPIFVAKACFRNVVGDIGHAFHSSSYYHLVDAQFDRLRSKHHSFHT